jgi:hypothetical protein
MGLDGPTENRVARVLDDTVTRISTGGGSDGTMRIVQDSTPHTSVRTRVSMRAAAAHRQSSLRATLAYTRGRLAVRHPGPIATCP